MQVTTFRFDQFELDLNSYELRRSGRLIKLERLPMELLILLVEKQGQLVTREEILQRLWGDNVFVDTRQGINTAVRKIRVALNDNSERPRLLQTVAGRGYRLLAAVSCGAGGAELPPALPPTQALPAEEPGVQTAPSSLDEMVITGQTALQTARGGARWLLGLTIIALVALVAGGMVAALWFLRRPLPHGVIEQRITANPAEAAIASAVVSPDGRYIAYADPGGLYLRQIASGETRPWPLPEGFRASPDSWFPDGWFPDGVHLLITRFEGPQRTPSLWKLSLLGGSPRKLLDHARAGSVSPDGSRIAFVTPPQAGSELWLMEADGSNPRKLAAASERDQRISRGSWIAKVAWSPNGLRVAYVERHGVTAPDPAPDVFSLRTRNANGGDLKVVLSDVRVEPAICWAADGRIFYAYREAAASGRMDEGIRAIRVEERSGEVTGQPEVVTDGVGRIGGLSVTRDGKRLVLWRVNTQLQAFVAEFDAGSRQLKTPRRFTMDTNTNLATAWMPDSKAVVFVSNRNGTWTLFKQAIDETTAEVLAEGRSIFLPRLSATGSQVLYESHIDPANTSLPVALMRVPVAGGAPQTVLQEAGITNYQCARLPSKLCLLSKLRGSDHIFDSFDPEEGPGHEILRTSNGYTNWSLSPDGTTLALFPNGDRIRFVSLDAGGARELKVVKLEGWSVWNGDWSADGRGVLIPSLTSGGTPVILEVDMVGKAAVVLSGAANTRFWAVIAAPDGRHAIVDAEIPGDNNVWMVDTP